MYHFIYDVYMIKIGCLDKKMMVYSQTTFL